jgi:predicted RND superfamily exporter protein|mmetsp:Transcript_17984/g.2931  ORF Transcript_17984/g.2931 Transcript_17984/m.2931 type:complete len:80 (-) Transcript_17984:185-424(-)
MIGIGVDDMYVLIFTLDQAPHDSLPIDKIKYMMKHAGTSITITSFTNVFSFTMGSLSSLPAIRVFCSYAALGMFFDYLN